MNKKSNIDLQVSGVILKARGQLTALSLYRLWNRTFKVKKIIALALAGSMLMTTTVFARTPRFNRSDEEWATLEDNNLEFNEIESLISEYNATVRSNEVVFAKFKKDYGSTNTQVSDHYRESAQEILDNLPDPDPSDPTYISALSAVANSRATAQNLLSTADSTLEDAEIIRLGYEQTEKTLVQTAVTNMISYKSGLVGIETAKSNLELANIEYTVAQAKLSAGTGTNIELLNAKEKVLSKEKEVKDAQSESSTLLKKLQVMTGWSYDASPQVGELPMPDINREFNPNADLDEAIKNNYSLRINEKKLGNAKSQSDRETLETTIADNKAHIATSLTVASQNITAAKENYNYAAEFAKLQENNLSIANQRYNLGLISKSELETQKFTTLNSKDSLIRTQYALLQAIVNYDFAVKGLASVS